MSLSSIKGLLSNYSPVSAAEDSDLDLEKHLRHGSDAGESSSVDDLDTNTDTNTKTPTNERTSGVDGRLVSDAIIGLSDGMTVPFALTAGLSALGDTKVVVFGGLAELIAGAISMGLGGYLGAKSEEESYHATRKETHTQALTNPAQTTATLHTLFAAYDLPPHLINDLTTHLSLSPHLPEFLMRFHHTLPEPSGSRALTCALTIALGYFVGGFVPLLPYFFVGPTEAFVALQWSIATMVVALFVFGYGKTCFVRGWTGRANVLGGVWGGVQMIVVGGVAAGSAMGLVKGFQALAGGTSE